MRLRSFLIWAFFAAFALALWPYSAQAQCANGRCMLSVEVTAEVAPAAPAVKSERSILKSPASSLRPDQPVARRLSLLVQRRVVVRPHAWRAVRLLSVHLR